MKFKIGKSKEEVVAKPGVESSAVSADPVLPPTPSVSEVPKQVEPLVQYVEREVTLSLVNEKINLLNQKIDYLIDLLTVEKV